MLTTYSRRRSAGPLPFLAPVALLLLLAAFQQFRGLPPIVATISMPASTTLGEAKALPWPTSGAAAFTVKGLGPLGASNDTLPRPIASITKIMTAYVILKGHPINPGERGPNYTITARDVSTYLSQAAQDQSVVPVSLGLQFTEFELLQGLLVPSANNFADILAVWDAGSVTAFVAKMNAEAAALGMRNTIYADPSGFSTASKSTAQDQLVLAQAVMQNAVFAEIVAQATARLPGVGLVSNVNTLLGQEGVAGIKTGFTEEAGGCLAFYARRQVGSQTVEVFGVVLGQPTRPAAFDSSRRLLAFTGTTLQSVRVMSRDQPVATLKPQWGDAVEVVAADEVFMVFWPGMALEASIEIDPVNAPLAAGAEVGRLKLQIGDQKREVPLKLSSELNKPGFSWRLTRI